MQLLVLLAVLLITALLALAADPPTRPKITPARETADGLLSHGVTSVYQRGANDVEVLPPDKLEPGRRYPVLYVLPVNTGTRGPWGSGILEAKRLNLHNRLGLICVAPAFDSMPWYADHPTDPAVRQESYILKVLLPMIEKRYPVLAEPKGRLLVGFSKSGLGAWSLLLRHPDIFGRAASWDAPLAEEKLASWGTGPTFGTQENFEKYRITDLLERRAELLRKDKDPRRLILLGYGSFKGHVDTVHRRMQSLGIPHVCENTTERRHDWRSGWLEGAVTALCAKAGPKAGTPGPKS